MNITYDMKEDVGTITLFKEPMNAMALPELECLFKNLTELNDNPDINFIIIKSGLTYGFSSGLDLRNLFVEGKKEETQNQVFEAVRKMYDINYLIVKSSKIYFASLSGPVIGSAVSLAFACDFRLADDNVWFWLPDPLYGGLLADGGIELLVHLAGKSRAAILGLSNQRINAAEANEWGLFYHVSSKDTLDKKINDTIKLFHTLSIRTLSATKRIMNKKILNNFEEEELRYIVEHNGIYERLSKQLKIRM